MNNIKYLGLGQVCKFSFDLDGVSDEDFRKPHYYLLTGIDLDPFGNPTHYGFMILTSKSKPHLPQYRLQQRPSVIQGVPYSNINCNRLFVASVNFLVNSDFVSWNEFVNITEINNIVNRYNYLRSMGPDHARWLTLKWLRPQFWATRFKVPVLNRSSIFKTISSMLYSYVRDGQERDWSSWHTRQPIVVVGNP